jgi:rhamnulokinase
VLPACHDTGSAYLAVPARDDKAIYLSSGTWSIIGVENEEAIATPESCAANFSNEGGAWRRFRFLKNIMGLWMIQSIRRELNGVAYVEGKGGEATAAALAGISDWERGRKYSFADLETAARAAGDFPSVVDAADKRFFSPESMTAAVCGACAESGQKVPSTVGELVQCVYSSLAQSYAKEAKLLASITGKEYTTLNIVGGGSQDAYLNDLTAKATGLEVVAGPTEGTAIGNLIVQMIASGEFADLAEARKAIVR